MVGDKIGAVVWGATQGFVSQRRRLDFISSAMRRHGRIVRREEIRPDLCLMLDVSLDALWRVGASRGSKKTN